MVNRSNVSERHIAIGMMWFATVVAIVSGCKVYKEPKTIATYGTVLTVTGEAFFNNEFRTGGRDPYYDALNDAEYRLTAKLFDVYLKENLQVRELCRNDKDLEKEVIAYSQRYQVIKKGHTGIGSYEVTLRLLLGSGFFKLFDKRLGINRQPVDRMGNDE